mgnify:CR=1 FL=1
MKKPFITIDCETDPFKEGRIPAPFIWGCYNGETEEYLEFDSTGEMVKYLERQSVIVLAHNGGRFDYHYLKDYINSDQPVMVIAGRMAKFYIGCAEFRDSMNILPVPLAAFQKTEFDYAKLEPDVRHLHMDEIRMYLKSDCVNLWNFIDRYYKDYGRTLTQAGASMKYWKKKFKPEFTPQSMAQSLLYRPYYYGGRVECFKTGHAMQDFQVIDINSAYPFAMLSNHPIAPVGSLSDRLPPGDMMTQCFIRLDAVARGCFPYREEGDMKLSFPNDDRIREYHITGWELLAAFECDAVDIIRIKDVHYFQISLNFTEYVHHFYEQRKIAKANKDKAGDIFAKLFLNSLYGKFASDPEKYSEYLIASDDTLAKWCGEPHGYKVIQPWGERHLMARPLPETKHRYYNVATAASITGFVRAHLFKALHQCDTPLYCDTDSIAAVNTGNVPMGDELGQFKHELTCDEYAIAGKKLYAFHGRKNQDAAPEWKIASKGVRLNHEQIITVAKGGKIRYAPEVPTYSIHKSQPTFIEREIISTI